MSCPRCKKQHSQILKFYFSERKVHLKAHVCQICNYIWAEDEDLLKAARKHLYQLAKPNEHRDRADRV